MRILKFLTICVLPVVIVLLYFYGPKHSGKLFITGFALFVVIERAIEGLYTSTDKKGIVGDWTLFISIFSYILLMFFCLSEFYFFNGYGKLTIAITAVGLFLYFMAMTIRLWAVVSLGDQWQIHILGENRRRNNFHIVKHGPYRYIRHPVYLGIIIEQCSIPLVFNAFFVFFIFGIFSLFFNNIKMRVEEEQLKNDFGDQYEEYIDILPRVNFLKRKVVREK